MEWLLIKPRENFFLYVCCIMRSFMICAAYQILLTNAMDRVL